MKPYLLLFSFYLMGCTLHKNDYLLGLENYIIKEQKLSFLQAMDNFDSLMVAKYPNTKEEKWRVKKFLMEYETAVFLSNQDQKLLIQIENDLAVFDNDIEKFRRNGLLDTLLTYDVYWTPKNQKMLTWISDITKTQFENKKFEEESFIIDTTKTKIIGKRNALIFGLAEISKKDSFEKKLLDNYVSYMPSNIISILKDDDNTNHLINPIVKATLVYYLISVNYNIKIDSPAGALPNSREHRVP